MNRKKKSLVAFNLNFHLQKQVSFGFQLFFQKISNFFIATKNLDLNELTTMCKKKFQSFNGYCREFLVSTSSILENLMKCNFNEVKLDYLFTIMMSDIITMKEVEFRNKNYKKTWEILLRELHTYEDIDNFKTIKRTTNELFDDVVTLLEKFIQECSNEEILSVFYLAMQNNEKMKSNNELFTQIKKSPEIVKNIKNHIINLIIPEQIYLVDFRNSELVALTISHGHILVNKKYFVKKHNSSKDEIIISKAQLFLIFLHELFHKMKLIANDNDYFNKESEGICGIYNFEGEIGEYFEKKVFKMRLGKQIDNISILEASTILTLKNYETKNIEILHKMAESLIIIETQKIKNKKKYEIEREGPVWMCKPLTFYYYK